MPGNFTIDLRMDSGITPVDATQVYPAFIRVRAALMMGIDAAGLAKVVLGRAGAPGVETQVLGALLYL